MSLVHTTPLIHSTMLTSRILPLCLYSLPRHTQVIYASISNQILFISVILPLSPPTHITTNPVSTTSDIVSLFKHVQEFLILQLQTSYQYSPLYLQLNYKFKHFRDHSFNCLTNLRKNLKILAINLPFQVTRIFLSQIILCTMIRPTVLFDSKLLVKSHFVNYG